jgi:sugar lactone lactonase YvrE
MKTRLFVPPQWVDYTWLCLLAACLLTACFTPTPNLLRPNGIALAPDGSLYVMDRGNYRVVHLAADGRLLDAFGQLGTGPTDIYAGWDIALDSAGNIYICHTALREDGSGAAYDEVKVFTPAGRLARELNRQDYQYDDGVPRNTPYDVTIDRQDRIYIANFGSTTLHVFNAHGEALGQFFGDYGSEDGQFQGLMAVAIDDQRDLIYITDQVNSRIQQFRRSVTVAGKLTLTPVLTFGEYGREPGQLAYPQYLAIDESSGRVYVSDMANQRIQVFTDQGEYVTQFSPLSSSAVKTWQVMGLALGQDGAVYAVDAFNNVIWIFEPDGRLRGRIEVAP